MGATLEGGIAFPYEPRPHQRELLATMRDALLRGGHAVVESGTGTGKTVCALAAALSVARRDGRRVVYLTRTNSQARQVMIEYRALRTAGTGAGVAIALQGRRHLCPLRADDDDIADADPEELSILCRDRMRAAEDERHGRRPRHAPCPYHARGLLEGLDDLAAFARDRAPEAEDLAAHAASSGRCPYVLTRALLPEAELVVAPYVYLFSPALRGAFLQWMGAGLGDIIVVVDEAHNLPDYARSLSTFSLGRRSLALAGAEAAAHGDADLGDGLRLEGMLRAVARALEEVAEESLGPLDATDSDEPRDALLDPDAWIARLLSALRVSTPTLGRALGRMEDYGARVRESRRALGKPPRSHVGNVAAFVRAFGALDAETHAPLAERIDREPRLTAFCVDPGDATRILQETAGSVHISGTLAPLDHYRDALALPVDRTALARFPSPFPPENRLVVIDSDVTTRREDIARDPAIWDDLADRLRALRSATDRNMAVFFPSYDILRRLAPNVRGAGVVEERRNEPQESLAARLASFRSARGATLLAVIGGRVSEGLDFPDDTLEVVVVVGLPYSPPSARLDALIRFHGRGGRDGWAGAVRAPMERRLLQTAGRLIRSERDRGVVVILDRRAATFATVFPGLRVVDDPASHVSAFFGTKS